MKPYVWIILGLLAVIVLMIWFWPEPKPTNLDAYRTQIAIQNLKIDSLTTASTKLATKIKADSLQQAQEKKAYIVTIEKKSREIAYMKQNPVVVKIRETTPEVNALIIEMERMDSVKTERITTLENNLDGLRIDMGAMEVNFSGLLQAEREKFATQNEMLAESMKENKKVRRSNRWLKAGAVAALVGGVFLGAR
jgi:uncharacterized protein YxeA